MRIIEEEIAGAADFELGRDREAGLHYIAALPEGPAKGLVFLIPGFGGDTDEAYADSLRRRVVEGRGMIAVSVRYHCFGARPATGARLEVDGRDHLMLLGLAAVHAVTLGDPKDLLDVAKRLQAAGVRTTLRATLKPARGEYQNFGIMQALDHLAVLGRLREQGAAFDERRIVALGSSHGGYIAHLMAKIAPRTLAMVIDNSSYTRPPMNYLGQETSSEYVAPLVDGIVLQCRTQSAWTTADRKAANFYDRNRDLIRDTAYSRHLATARAASSDQGCVYRMVNSSVDSISPPEMKLRQAAALRAAGFDARLLVVEEEHLDGKLFKRLAHGLDASLAGLLDLGLAELAPRETALDADLRAEVSYDCVDVAYRFAHSTSAPYVTARAAAAAAGDEETGYPVAA